MAREIKVATDLVVPSPPINDYKGRLVKLNPFRNHHRICYSEGTYRRIGRSGK